MQPNRFKANYKVILRQNRDNQTRWNPLPVIFLRLTLLKLIIFLYTGVCFNQFLSGTKTELLLQALWRGDLHSLCPAILGSLNLIK